MILIVISGTLMWWLRKPAGLLGAPPVTRPRFSAALTATILALAPLLPPFGLSLLAVAAIDRAVLPRLPQAQLA